MSEMLDGAIEVALQNTYQLVKILSMAKENKSETMRKLINGELKYPKVFKGYLWKTLGLNKVKKSCNHEETHKYLCRHLDMMKANMNWPTLDCTDYYQLLSFLINEKQFINYTLNAKLKATAVYGYFLEQFSQVFIMKQLKNETTTTLKDFLKEHLNISDSYSRKLRWLGKLFYKYERIQSLCISLNELYKRKVAIENMLNLDNEKSQFWMNKINL
ncbi:unnamed protein product [Rotaria socialis]|uniref:Uncharacterized protein n=1 Tax=Rotaria socialis TaxID=392032 RepID=A0A821VSB1_9BILA|nr:unnamed protein product [Rotaria socialis]CAF4911710.1 unnamed protein product [Rotaria socialis]